MDHNHNRCCQGCKKDTKQNASILTVFKFALLFLLIFVILVTVLMGQ